MLVVVESVSTFTNEAAMSINSDADFPAGP